MRRGVIMLALAAIASTATAAAAKAPEVGVSPSSGGRAAKFTVSFRAPDSAGTAGGLTRIYTVSAVDRTTARGCVSDPLRHVTTAAAHSRVRVTLSPRASGGAAWCKGTFHGEVTEISRPVCEPIRGEMLACPMFIVIDKRLGTFTFRVH